MKASYTLILNSAPLLKVKFVLLKLGRNEVKHYSCSVYKRELDTKSFQLWFAHRKHLRFLFWIFPTKWTIGFWNVLKSKYLILPKKRACRSKDRNPFRSIGKQNPSSQNYRHFSTQKNMESRNRENLNSKKWSSCFL